MLPTVVSFHGADAGVDRDRPRHRAAMLELFAPWRTASSSVGSAGGGIDRASAVPEAKIRLNLTGIPTDEWPLVTRQPPPKRNVARPPSLPVDREKGLGSFPPRLRRPAPDPSFARNSSRGRRSVAGLVGSSGRELGIAAAVSFAGFLNEPGLDGNEPGPRLPPSQPDRKRRQSRRRPELHARSHGHGLACLATRHGGIPEAIDRRVSGLLVPENDGPALTAALRRLVEDPELAWRLGAQGSMAVAEKFSSAARVADLERLYQAVMLQKNR